VEAEVAAKRPDMFAALKVAEVRRTPPLVASVGVDWPWGFHGFGQATADRAQDEGWDGALWREGEIGGFGREFDAAIEAEAGFAKEFGAEAHVFGSIDAPKPELFFVTLQEIDRFLQFFHGFIEIGGQKEHAEEPGVARVTHSNAYAILATLIAFDGTTVIVADSGHTAWHGVHQSLRVLALDGH
jgi:hypothetical protein